MTVGRDRRIGVVYLARAADGLASFERFAASYRAHPAGTDHDLVVLYKGFETSAAAEMARAVFDDLPRHGLTLEDVGFDIGSYLEAAERLDHDALCFLNTHSEIAAPGWLATLAGSALPERIGLVGAMGSYESIFSTVQLLERVIEAARRPWARRSAALASYYDFLLPRFRPDWYAPSHSSLMGQLRALARQARDALPGAARRDGAHLRGTALIWPGAPEIDTAAFPPFPNPHIRSNAFLIDRRRLLALDVAVIRTKADANLFESGGDSLTNQVLRAGLTVLVAGRDGTTYEVPDWSRSGTFRLGDQTNLLVGDNHTRSFAAMSAGAKAAHARMTWGDYLGPKSRDAPEFGVSFPIASTNVATTSDQRAKGFDTDMQGQSAPADLISRTIRQ